MKKLFLDGPSVLLSSSSWFFSSRRNSDETEALRAEQEKLYKHPLFNNESIVLK
jgi:hypothetical protein